MTSHSGNRMRFVSQVLLLQIAVVLAVVATCTLLFSIAGIERLKHEAESTALAVAQSVAEDSDVRRDVERVSAAPTTPDAATLAASPIASIARSVERRTGALFVVIADDQGIRLAHPNPDLLGKVVSTSPDSALRGEETVSFESGTLGESARAKVPVYGLDDKTVVGEVSVGYARARVFDSFGEDAIAIAAAAAAALAIGVGASVLIRRRLNRLTLGLQPEELTTLVQNQQAVLGGVGEGVIGVGSDGIVTVCNQQAAGLLGLSGDSVGRDVHRLGLPAELIDRMREARGPDSEPQQVVVGQKVLFVDVRAVFLGGRDLGHVLVLRDRTDVEDLSRRLSAVATMTTALRAQRHEFANSLHVISGLLHSGQGEQARSYLATVLDHGPLRYPVKHADLLTEHYLQAFLGAKGIEASERGVSLSLGPETLVTGTVAEPEDVTTVLGNLLDNAVTAAVVGVRQPAWVEVEILDAGRELYLSVMDSGDGFSPRTDEVVPVEADDPIHGQGFGLPLSRDIARRRGGDVWLADPGGGDSGHGAVFCVRLPGVMAVSVGSEAVQRTVEDGRRTGDGRR